MIDARSEALARGMSQVNTVRRLQLPRRYLVNAETRKDEAFAELTNISAEPRGGIDLDYCDFPAGAKYQSCTRQKDMTYANITLPH